MRVLGVDPGTTRVGYGLVEYQNNLRLVDYGVIEIASKGLERFRELKEKFSRLLEASKPELAGIEKLFFAKNQKTALQVSESRGVIIHLLIEHKIPVRELRPGEVKQSVTSYGFADKKAVAKMVKKILNMEGLVGSDDASDALAIAITTAYSHKSWGLK